MEIERTEANALAEAWRTSEVRYHERRRREAQAQWYAFHLDQAERIERTAEELAQKHRVKAEALLEESG